MTSHCGKGPASWLHENKQSWRGGEYVNVRITDPFASPSSTWMVWHEILKVGWQYYFRAGLDIQLAVEDWSWSGQAIYFCCGICKFLTLGNDFGHFGKSQGSQSQALSILPKIIITLAANEIILSQRLKVVPRRLYSACLDQENGNVGQLPADQLTDKIAIGASLPVSGFVHKRDRCSIALAPNEELSVERGNRCLLEALTKKYTKGDTIKKFFAWYLGYCLSMVVPRSLYLVYNPS